MTIELLQTYEELCNRYPNIALSEAEKSQEGRIAIGQSAITLFLNWFGPDMMLRDVLKHITHDDFKNEITLSKE